MKEMKGMKKLTLIFMICTLVFQAWSHLVKNDIAIAATIVDDIIEDVKLTILDGSGNTVTEVVYEQGAAVRLDYIWAFDDDRTALGHGYEAGDTYTFEVPEAFYMASSLSNVPLNTSLGQVGVFHYHHSTREIEMVFNANIEGQSLVGGTMTLETRFDESVLTGSTTQEIKIPIGTVEKIVTLQFKPQGAKAFEKRGEPIGFNPKEIKWTIDVNKTLNPLENPVVSDELPTGLILATVGGSVYNAIEVFELDIQMDGTIGAVTPAAPADYTTQIHSNDAFSVSFNGTTNQAYRIEVITEITDHIVDSETYVNEAELTSDDAGALQAAATVDVQYGQAIAKHVTAYSNLTQVIDWQITYNYNEQEILQADAALADRFTNDHELDTVTLAVYKVDFDIHGTEINLTPLIAGTHYLLTPVTNDPVGKNGFDLQFLNDIDSAYKITYQTKPTAVSPVYNSTSIENEVISMQGSSSGQQPIQQMILHKGWYGADYMNKQVNWRITINQNNYLLEDVVLEDIFPVNDGLTLVAGSLQIRDAADALLTEGVDYTLVYDPLDLTAGFTVEFTDDITEKHVVSFTTKYFDESLFLGTSHITNHAEIAWASGGNDFTQNASATFTPRAEARNNGFKHGSYNAQTKIFTWTIGINYHEIAIQEAIVQDILLSEQQFIPGSLRVYDMNIALNGTPSQGALINANLYTHDYDTATNELTVSFENPISSAYYIVFDTSLEGKLIEDETVENNAYVFDDLLPVSNALHAAIDIQHSGEYVSKSGTQDDEYIDWTIFINRGQSYVEDASIHDVPSVNQKLVEPSFRLFATTVAANGDVTKAAELTRDIDYELMITSDSNGHEEFELHFLTPIDSAYILEYKTLIQAQNGDEITNEVSFSGMNVSSVTKSTEEKVIVAFSSASGTGSGVTGKLTVYKVDAADPLVQLEGATFTLHRDTIFGLILIDTLTTGPLGEIEFDHLLLGNYIVEEVAAPAGYDLDSTPQLVEISAGHLEVELTLANAEIVGELSITKVEKGNPAVVLEDAEFTLFQNDGSNLIEVATKKTDEFGSIEFTDLKLGDYVLQEITAPDGYVLDDTEYPFTITSAARSIMLQIENEKQREPDEPEAPVQDDGQIKVLKVDHDDPDAGLMGAEFLLQRKTGHTLTDVAALTTDSEGKLEFKQLPYGDYVLTEIHAPEGYELDAAELAVTVSSVVKVIELVIENKKSTADDGQTDQPSSEEDPEELDVEEFESEADSEVESASEGDGDEVIHGDSTQEVSQAQATLPQTGETSKLPMQLAGLALVLAGLVLLIRKRRIAKITR